MPVIDSNSKKVEYIELIYDLIFVYLIGRSNSLLETGADVLFRPASFAVYLLSTLMILQVWFFSMMFINRHGRNSLSDHIGLFINMYLLYYVAEGIRGDWTEYFAQFNIAWGLILVNIAVQYILQLHRTGEDDTWALTHIAWHAGLLLAQAAVVFISIPVYNATGIILSGLALAVGFAGAVVTGSMESVFPVNFEHLTERVMLYIVFTFGEMVVSEASYFEGGFSLNSVYFSFMAFAIVFGLLVYYGYLYNHMIERERPDAGTGYMAVHIPVVMTLNNISIGLELMTDDRSFFFEKNVFLTVSILLYYVFLFLLVRYARPQLTAGRRELFRLIAAAVAFAVLMLAFYKDPIISIAVTALYVFGMLVLISGHFRAQERKERIDI